MKMEKSIIFVKKNLKLIMTRIKHIVQLETIVIIHGNIEV